MASTRRDAAPSPLRTNWFHILVALAAEDRHGRAIARDVLEQTNGALRLWPATLYGTLEQMSDAGLVEELPLSAQPDRETERRNYYHITGAGRRALRAESDRLEQLARLAQSRMTLRGSTAR